MRRPSRRTLAYLLLWALFALILFWRRAPEAPLTVVPGAAPPPTFRINLNSDPWERIMVIEGIGETLARRIVQAREERGRFRTLEDVMSVAGVPDGVLERARPWLIPGANDRSSGK